MVQESIDLNNTLSAMGNNPHIMAVVNANAKPSFQRLVIWCIIYLFRTRWSLQSEPKYTPTLLFKNQFNRKF